MGQATPIILDPGEDHNLITVFKQSAELCYVETMQCFPRRWKNGVKLQGFLFLWAEAVTLRVEPLER